MGHTIIGCGRRVTRLKELKQALANVSSAKHLLAQCDVTDASSVKQFAHDVLHREKVVPDIVFANAGISIPTGPLWEVSASDFQHIFQVNVYGVFLVLQHFIPAVLKASRVQGSPYKRILATSSGLGHSTSPILGPYSATKFSVEALMKSVAQSLEKETNIGAWPLAPGIIQSEMMVHPKMPTASDWARDACPFILELGRPSANTPSGASVSVPGYYPKKYLETWILEDGKRLPTQVSAPFAE